MRVYITFDEYRDVDKIFTDREKAYKYLNSVYPDFIENDEDIDDACDICITREITD